MAMQVSIEVDVAKAKTKIQIRFHDGTRKAQEFNEDRDGLRTCFSARSCHKTWESRGKNIVNVLGTSKT